MRSTWLLGVGAILITAVGCTSSPAPASHRPTTTATEATGAVSVGTAHSTTESPSATVVGQMSARPVPTASKKLTLQFVVRPVRADGTAVSGYRVAPESNGGPTQCQDASPVAVSRDIRFCGDSALDTVACWSSATPSYVLCLRSPFTRLLARIEYTGGFAPLAAPAHPSPQALVLDDGTRCVVRDGGAWDTVPGHPTWYGQYSCTGGVDVYGPIPDGIDRTAPLWTVHTVSDANTAVVRSRSVRSAYFVGTA
jgi:hypothetical protein